MTNNKTIDGIFNVMTMDVNRAFELKDSLKKCPKVEEVEIVKTKRISGIWYNVCYTFKKNS